MFAQVSDILGPQGHLLLPNLSTAFGAKVLIDSSLSPTYPQAHPQETLCSRPPYLYVEDLEILF